MLNISHKLHPERISYLWLLPYDRFTTYFGLFDALVSLHASLILKDFFNNLVKKYDVSARAVLELKKIQSKISKKNNKSW